MASTTTPLTTEQRQAKLLDFIRRIDPEADLTSIRLFRQVHKVDHLLTRAAEKQLELAGLSWPKFMLLMALQGNEAFGAGGGMQPTELSELHGIPRNTVSELLAGLEDEGFISRELHGTDRRKFVIRLTPQGRKTLKSKVGTQLREVTRCFAALDTQERAILLQLLTRLSESLTKAGNCDGPARQAHTDSSRSDEALKSHSRR